MNVRIAGPVEHTARRVEQAVHGQPKAISNQKENQRAQHTQVAPGLTRNNRPARRHHDAAFQQIEKRGAEQTKNKRHQREVVEKPDEGQAEEIKAQIDSEERVRLVHGHSAAGQQVLQPVAGSPVAHHVPDQQHAYPDDPAKCGAEPVESGELDCLVINAITGASRETAGDREIGGENRHEAETRESAELDLRLQNIRVEHPETLLPEPEPIHQQVDNVGNQWAEDQQEQQESHNEANSAFPAHFFDSPESDVRQNRARVVSCPISSKCSARELRIYQLQHLMANSRFRALSAEAPAYFASCFFSNEPQPLFVARTKPVIHSGRSHGTPRFVCAVKRESPANLRVHHPPVCPQNQMSRQKAIGSSGSSYGAQ